MSESERKTSYIGEAWLVILLSVLFGGSLAFVHTTLGPRIAENKRNETYSVIPLLVPGAAKEGTEELIVRGRNGKDSRVYRARSADGSERGWVLPASGQGFADRIELLIGLDAGLETITGLYVLDQKETPGLGDNIKGEDFRGRFVGRPAASPVSIVKGEVRSETEVRALTGATISSESVARIVNDALANLREVLLQSGTPTGSASAHPPGGSTSGSRPAGVSP
jgi:electron transport complex protein RnfG